MDVRRVSNDRQPCPTPQGAKGQNAAASKSRKTKSNPLKRIPSLTPTKPNDHRERDGEATLMSNGQARRLYIGCALASKPAFTITAHGSLPSFLVDSELRREGAPGRKSQEMKTRCAITGPGGSVQQRSLDNSQRGG